MVMKFADVGVAGLVVEPGSFMPSAQVDLPDVGHHAGGRQDVGLELAREVVCVAGRSVERVDDQIRRRRALQLPCGATGQHCGGRDEGRAASVRDAAWLTESMHSSEEVS